ncbi:hypothetical protein MASR1M46_09530 [Bacteroidales bacterium]
MDIKGLIVTGYGGRGRRDEAEYYFSFAVDRNAKSVVAILSREEAIGRCLVAKLPERYTKYLFSFVEFGFSCKKGCCNVA